MIQKYIRLLISLISTFILLVTDLSCSGQLNVAQLKIVKDGKSSYVILIAADPSEMEMRAAERLDYFIEKVTGLKLKVLQQNSRSSTISSPLIRLIQNKTNGLLHPDGFKIYTNNENLIIEGGSRKGLLYGVYSFIEDYLGCKLFAANVYSIPTSKNITLSSNLNVAEEPAFDYRATFFRELVSNAEYPDWHKLFNIYDYKTHTYVFENWGLFVHSFDKLVPPAVYFSSHPEYFALVKGKRKPSQLCLSNPEVLQIAINALRAEISKNPAPEYWSVSQNDNFDYCQCPLCSKVYQEEGGPQGTIIRFVNEIAKQFPQKTISTLAYQYSRAAPLKTKPVKNVNIMLCYQVDRTSAITEDKKSQSFIQDLDDWQKLTKNLFIWNYIVQFTNLQAPYPNLYLLQPDIQYFQKKGIKMIFEQGWDKGEFSELRSYIVAKLMWNPNLDIDQTIEEFLKGYYGDASRFIKQYITLIDTERKKNKKVLEIFGNMTNYSNYFFTTATLEAANMLFDQAEAAVKNKQEILERVQIARLPVEFMDVELARKKIITGKTVQNRNVINNNDLQQKLTTFVNDCKKLKINSLSLSGKTPDQYYQETLKAVDRK